MTVVTFTVTMKYYAQLQVMQTLRFYANGTFQKIVGELFGVSQSMASRTISRVTKTLVQNIKSMPSERSLQSERRQRSLWFLPNMEPIWD